MNLRTQQQGSQTEISERQHHVIVLMHVAMVQEMMAVQAEKDSGAFDISFTRQMHAPVDVFVRGVIANTRRERSPEKGPMPGYAGDNNERGNTDGDQYRAVPPGHRDGVLVLFAPEMIGRIGLKDAVVYEGVALEWVGEFSKGAVHKIFMQQPFEQGAENGGNQETGRQPKQDIMHVGVLGVADCEGPR